MTIAYNWTISTCEREVSTGGITVAHWRVAAEDGDYAASAYGTASFSPDPSAPGFKPYADVTEADVLSWVWEQVDKNAAEASLASQIAAQQNPTTATGTPW
jgi:hypothetical protein